MTIPFKNATRVAQFICRWVAQIFCRLTAASLPADPILADPRVLQYRYHGGLNTERRALRASHREHKRLLPLDTFEYQLEPECPRMSPATPFGYHALFLLSKSKPVHYILNHASNLSHFEHHFFLHLLRDV